MTDTAVDFLLENLEQLIIDCDKRMNDTAAVFWLSTLDHYRDKLIQREQVEWFYKEMQFLRQFLKDSEGKRNEQEVKDLVARIRDVTHEVENSFDFFAFFASMPKKLQRHGVPRRENIVASSSSMVNIPIPWNEILATSKIEINSIKEELMKIYKWNMYGIGEPQIGKSSHQSLSRATSPVIEEEIIVGFVDDTTKILELLTIGENQRKVIPIIGMAGLGKTTLANKVYNDPATKYRFYKQAWSYVSQVYHKRDLLLSIFTSAQIQLPSNVDQLNDDQLGGELYKRLKGYRYLIVLDDLWNSEAWDDLKRYFPNDNNGSRIMFTSRNVNVAVALDAEPYNLNFLNDEESWDLLQIRAFRKEGCPSDLVEIGKIIAKKCRGLPLAIVVLSGLLAKKDKTQDWWSYVAENVSSYIVSDLEQYMDTLALSYNNLPHHLQPCFLYFGAFPEDYEFHVRQLIWLWVAEGFIRQNGQNEQKSLEELAEDYLMDLIDRSLVIVSRKRSNGGVKSCRVHDLLRDLCLRKAHEENFLRQIPWYKEAASSSNPVAHQQRRMCIHDKLVGYTPLKHYELHIRSFLSFGRSLYNLPEMNISFVCQAYSLLRVLNLLSIKILIFPKEIARLIHLRYLALYVEPVHEFSQPLPVFKSQNVLETLIVDGPKGSLPLPAIWKMVKLRHVYTRRLIEIEKTSHGNPFELHNLKTIGKLYLRDGDSQVLKCFPNLEKLKCQYCTRCPRLDFLIHLNTLNLVHDGYGRLPHLGMLPPNLKSLTLSYCRLPWEEMSTLGSLPNLEILKLSYKAFEGARWETNDGKFHKLRFLKFQGLDIQHWEASSNHFANLQTLVFDDCQRLEEIPSCLGDIDTLEMIQVRWCSRAVENSARQIQEEQKSMGNDELKIVIYSLD